MAAGIGGRTIASAKRAMTVHELYTWQQYRAKGLLITAHTHEYVAAKVVQALRGGKLEDFLPQRDVPAAPQGATVAQAMAILGGTIKKRPKK